MKHFLRSSASTLRVDFEDDEGAAVAASAVTVAITDSAGIAMAAVASPVSDGGTPDGSRWKVELTAANLAALDEYEAVWSATIAGASGQQRRDRFQVVGGHYFSIADARAFDNNALNDTAKWPTATILRRREEVEEALEDACGVAFVRRGARETLDGTGAPTLTVPHRRVRKVLSASIGGVALTAAEIDDIRVRGRHLIRKTLGSWTAGDPGNVVVHYEHGHDTPPERVRRASLRLLREALSQSPSMDARTLTISDELGTRQLAVAGRGRRFGIPEVDAIVDEFDVAIPGVA